MDKNTLNSDSADTAESYKIPEEIENPNVDPDRIEFVEKTIQKNQIKKTKMKVRLPFKPVKPRRKLIPKYFTDGKMVTDATIYDLDKDACPYHPPESKEVFSRIVMDRRRRLAIQNNELAKTAMNKLAKKGRLNKNLFHRLYVKVPPPVGTKTVTDYDKDFHRVIKGRPTADSFNIRDYIQTVRDVLKTKIILGYREDDIMIINQNLENEQRVAHQVAKYLNAYIRLFDDLLAKDHMEAVMILKQADDVAAKLFERNVEFKTLKKMYNSMKAGLYSSEEKWNNCKTYQKFLFYISPLHYKIANAEQVRDYNVTEGISTTEEEHMFDEKSLESRETSVETMIDNIRNDCRTAAEPKLYFKDPQQILDIFNYMETQNLSYLLRAEELAVPLENINNNMEWASTSFDKQINDMVNIVEELSIAIEWEEHRAEELEKMALSLIYKDFKELIMADDILNLHVCIEDVYESRIGPNDANLDVLEMMTSIEKRYREEVLTLDKIPHELVASLEGSFFTEQIKVLKLAEKAAKQFSQLEVLTKQLKRAYAPKYEKGHGKEAKNRSKLVVPPKPKPPPPRSLTKEEEEYLEFFTDFCKYTDDPASYGIKIPTNNDEINEPISSIENVPAEGMS